MLLNFVQMHWCSFWHWGQQEQYFCCSWSISRYWSKAI